MLASAALNQRRGVIPYLHSARIQSSYPITSSCIVLGLGNQIHLALKSHEQRPRNVFLDQHLVHLLTGLTSSKSDDSLSTLARRLRLEVETRSEDLENTTKRSSFSDSADLLPLVQDCDNTTEDCAWSSRAVSGQGQYSNETIV